MDIAWIALSLQPHIGIKTLRLLQTHFDGDLFAALQTTADTLQRIPGIGPRIAQSVKTIRLAEVEQQLDRWQRTGVTCLPFGHADYPAPLKMLEDAPATLFMRGSIAEMQWQKTAALVGTRTPSQAARQSAFEIAALLAKAGYTIVSGLAAGIDATAHNGALSVPDGQTVAVLGCGVSNVYPPENMPLSERILKHGAIFSEVAPDSGVNAARLVARNRIISGLSQHVVVVETEDDGGAMYAARAAVAAGRLLYTLDLPASGNQQLLSQGADLLDAFYPHLRSRT
jgi:DNA processing protein